jgi:hypothetical protein
VFVQVGGGGVYYGVDAPEVESLLGVPFTFPDVPYSRFDAIQEYLDRFWGRVYHVYHGQPPNLYRSFFEAAVIGGESLE